MDKIINENINHDTMMVITPNGEKISNVSRHRALQMASDLDLDLVLMSGDDVTPAICKIMNHQKFAYEQKKNKKKNPQQKTETKELRYKPNTQINDINRLIKQAQGFINNSNNVKFTVIFKGREVCYSDKVLKTFTHITESLVLPKGYEFKYDSIVSNNRMQLLITK